MRKVMTIDGPGGVGKGTVSAALAQEYGFAYLDSGALYRLAALMLQREKMLEVEDVVQADKIEKMQIRFVTQPQGGVAAYLDHENVEAQIRSEEIGQLASKLAAKASIRTALLSLQRHFADGQTLVADGRDMGTVVFPSAVLKIFLDAAPAVRAQRRYKQLKAKGENVTLAALEKEIAERDARDRNRPVAPLKPASDAVVIDTTELSVAAVLQQVRELMRPIFN